MRTSDRTRLVIADDHPGVLAAAASLLAPTCDVVATTADGPSAIDAALHLRPDIVVLDIEMPGLDGFQTAAQIRRGGSNASIVFLSNHAGDAFVLAALSRGASAFVAKMRMERDLAAAVAHVRAGRVFVPAAAVLPRWSRPAGPRHDLQLYTTDAFLIDAVMEFFETALDVGGSIVAVVSEPHRRALDAQLSARGLDTAPLLASGRYTVGDSAEALAAISRHGKVEPARWPEEMEPLLARALPAAPGGHVWIFGEIAPILCARGEFDAMLDLERVAGDYIASRPVSILCAYSTDCLAGAVAQAGAVCACHAAIVPADDAIH